MASQLNRKWKTTELLGEDNEETKKAGKLGRSKKQRAFGRCLSVFPRRRLREVMKYLLL
jgi:hypothetical protein